jgi:hypothetical protein
VNTDAFGQCPVGHSDKQHIDEQQVDLLGGRCPDRFKAWSVPGRISLIFLAHPYVIVCRNRSSAFSSAYMSSVYFVFIDYK